MSAEKIEFVKPPATPNKERKLAAFGSTLVLLGLLGATQGAVVATQVRPGATGLQASGSTVTWTGTYAFDDFEGVNPYNQLAVCAETTVTCDFASALQVYSPNSPATSSTLYSTWNYNGTPYGPNMFQVRLILVTPSADGETREAIGDPVPIGPLAPCCNNPPPSGDPDQDNSSGTVQRSAVSEPPVAIEMQIALPANLLFSGSREFSLEAPNMSEVTEMTINGRPLPIVGRNKKSLKIRVPFLRPGSYSVVVSTETESWIIPNAITIGELPANIKSEGLDESFLKFSSELPSQTKQEIRSLIEETPDLKSVTVFAIAKREIIGEDRNKLARSRAASAYEFITRIDPEVVVRTEIIHYTEVELTSRGLFFKVTQKKQP